MRAIAAIHASCLLLGLASVSCGSTTNTAVATPSAEAPTESLEPVATTDPAVRSEAPVQPLPTQRTTLADDLARAGVGNVFVFVPADTLLFAAASSDGAAWARTTHHTAFQVAAPPDAGFVRVTLFRDAHAALTTGICSRPSGVSTTLPMALSLYVPLAALETVVHDPLDYHAPNGDRLRVTPGTPFSSPADAALLVDEARTFHLDATAAQALSLGDSLTCEGSRCARADEPTDTFPSCFEETTLSSLQAGFGRATFDGGVIRAEGSTRAVLGGSCVRADLRDAPELASWTCVAPPAGLGSADTEPGVLMGADVGGSLGTGGLGFVGTGAAPSPASSSHAPRVALPPPDAVSGGLSREQVQRVVRRNLGAIRQCHLEALALDPDARGRALVEFSVAENGAVASARIVQRTLTTASVDTCITGTVRSWAFPEPDGGTALVRQAFDFHTPGQPTAPVLRVPAGTPLVTQAGEALGTMTTSVSLELDPAASSPTTACFRVPLVNAHAEPPALACLAR